MGAVNGRRLMCTKKLAHYLSWDTPPSEQEQRMRKQYSAETSMPSVEKYSNTILVPVQQFLVPLMLHSAPPAPLSRRLPADDCLADLVVDIGPVAGIHLAPPIHWHLESNSYSPCLFFSHRRNFLYIQYSLGRHRRNCYLGKHLECSL